MILTPHDVPAPAPGEGPAQYGSRLLRFLLANDHTIGLLADEQLAIAHYAAHRALSTPNTIADEQSPACVYDRIEDLRRDLTRSMKTRQADRDQALTQLEASHQEQPGTSPTPLSDRPNLGPMAKLIPPDKPQPPQGGAALPEYAEVGPARNRKDFW